MKYLFLILISTYSRILSPFLKSALGVRRFCRFYPTCSEYAKISIRKYGIYKGAGLSIKRLIKCQPFYRA